MRETRSALWAAGRVVTVATDGSGACDVETEDDEGAPHVERAVPRARVRKLASARSTAAARWRAACVTLSTVQWLRGAASAAHAHASGGDAADAAAAAPVPAALRHAADLASAAPRHDEFHAGDVVKAPSLRLSLIHI